MICWIHGANSTDRSFNYLKSILPIHERLVFEYSTNVPLETNIKNLEELLKNNSVNAIIGHSLGGVMAAIMHKQLDIPKGVAISSPLGGFSLANFFPVSQMLLDVASTRPVFRKIASYQFDENFLSIVSSNDGGYSDGVVSTISQSCAKGSTIIKLDVNHFEVLLDPKVGDIINEHIFQ